MRRKGRNGCGYVVRGGAYLFPISSSSTSHCVENASSKKSFKKTEINKWRNKNIDTYFPTHDRPDTAIRMLPLDQHVWYLCKWPGCPERIAFPYNKLPLYLHHLQNLVQTPILYIINSKSFVFWKEGEWRCRVYSRDVSQCGWKHSYASTQMRRLGGRYKQRSYMF